MILMLVSCFLSFSRLDEMSYGTFHVQYGFKNKVTTKIPLGLTKECDTTIRNTSCFFFKRKTTIDCFFVYLSVWCVDFLSKSKLSFFANVGNERNLKGFSQEKGRGRVQLS